MNSNIALDILNSNLESVQNLKSHLERTLISTEKSLENLKSEIQEQSIAIEYLKIAINKLQQKDT